jgi:hypothetical protein
VVFYGIASALSDDIEGWYLTREAAESTLAKILRTSLTSRANYGSRRLS